MFDKIRRALGMTKDETPVPSKPPLTEKEIIDAERYFFTEVFTEKGKVPSNQDIANYLKRNINEVNDVRREINERFLGLATQPKKATFFRADFLRNQESSNFPVYKNSGGRRTNKNKKNCKKLSRRRSNKKNRKSMKRK